MIKTSLANAMSFIENLPSFEPRLAAAHRTAEERTGAGSDYLGWLRLPAEYDKNEFNRVKAAAERIRSDSEALIVIGIGGSYLGARAAIEFLRSPNYNLKKKKTPDIYFAGNNLSPDYLTDIIELIDGRDFSINVISKSGTTTEPAIAFRIFKKLIEDRYGKEASKRIYATTDKARGALKTLADAEGYESFVIPDDIGGRYSVLTAVGLLPIAVSGADIDALMAGAYSAMNEFSAKSMANPVWQYAGARNALYEGGRNIEILASYEPGFRYVTEWWKQLYGESEGKDLKGIFPAGVDLTADLHSMGQYIQDGERRLFETVVSFAESRKKFAVPDDPRNIDGLNFLSGMDLHEINEQARRGTLLAHVDGGVPNIGVELARQDEYNFGELVYFFELACGISGYTLGINPFDQPGVESYKVNMFALLNKPGYEKRREELMKRL